MTKNIVDIDGLDKLNIEVKAGDKVFLYGDLGSGKTTLTGKIINKLLQQELKVQSPTYIHYKKYLDNIYHFDLYRLESYDDFVNIGGEEILDDENNICIIEWPELIEPYYKASINIKLEKTKDESLRSIDIF